MASTTPPVMVPLRRWPPSVLALLAANAFPLGLVLTHQWSVFAVILLYWCENVIVGGFNVLRMLWARPHDALSWAGKVFLIPFFLFHYGMFTFVHGIFVVALFGGNALRSGVSFSPFGLLAAVRHAGLGWPLVALAGSHAFSFFHNYVGGGEYRRVSPQQLLVRPYGRVVVLHLTILGAGFLVMALGSPLAGLALLIVVKTVVDAAAHVAERRKLALAGLEEPTA